MRVPPGSTDALVNAPPRVHNWGAKANVALVFASLAAVLVVAAFVTAFVVRPPALGWVGFAIVSALVAGLGVVATLALPRMRKPRQDDFPILGALVQIVSPQSLVVETRHAPKQQAPCLLERLVPRGS